MSVLINIGNRTSTYTITEPDSIINLAKFDSINVQNGNGIVQGSNVDSDDIVIDGEIHITGGSAVRLFGLNNTVTTGFDSIITGNIGIWLLQGTMNDGLGGSTLVTQGQIVASEVGIRSENRSTAILNLGTIRADSAIVGVTHGLNVSNKEFATIEGEARGIDLSGVTDGSQRSFIVNDGTISGDIAIVGGAGMEGVFNHGTINGNILLGAGADLFDGRGGTVNGVIQGGAGDDTYIVDSTDISLQEMAGGGTGDMIQSTVSYTLHNNFENLVLLGSARINGTGNAAANSMQGNAGNNILRGAGGADTLAGGRGNDSLYGGSDSDRFVFEGRFGHDRIEDFAARGKQHDVIDLSGVHAIDSFSDLMKHHVREHKGDLIINAGHGDMITLHNIDKGDLHAVDFLF